MKKLLYNISLVGILMMLLSSCDLDLQTDYDYNQKVDDPHINMQHGSMSPPTMKTFPC